MLHNLRCLRLILTYLTILQHQATTYGKYCFTKSTGAYQRQSANNKVKHTFVFHPGANMTMTSKIRRKPEEMLSWYYVHSSLCSRLESTTTHYCVPVFERLIIIRYFAYLKIFHRMFLQILKKCFYAIPYIHTDILNMLKSVATLN